ncbi:MAG: hypothetical protein KDA99_08165, partial [Planctomycetales bacterium]|nr:hypothetical protein [Planctomycetales bacterium]
FLTTVFLVGGGGTTIAAESSNGQPTQVEVLPTPPAESAAPSTAEIHPRPRTMNSILESTDDAAPLAITGQGTTGQESPGTEVSDHVPAEVGPAGHMSDADVPQRTVTPVVPQSVVSTQRAISRQGDIPSRASVRARPVVPSQPPVTTRVPTQVATASRVVASTPAMRVPTTGTARYAQASLPVYQAPAAGTVVVPQRVLVVTDPRGLANGRVQRAVARAVSTAPNIPTAVLVPASSLAPGQANSAGPRRIFRGGGFFRP